MIYPLLRLKQIASHPSFLFTLLKRSFFYKRNSFNYNSKFKNIQQMSPWQTLEYIIKHNKSIMRFGDGELGLLQGMGIFVNITGWNRYNWCQEYSLEIKQEMQRLLSLENPEIVIAVPPIWQIVHDDKKNRAFAHKEEIYSNMHVESRMFLWRFLHRDQVYGSWSLFMPRHSQNFNWSILRDFLQTKHIVILTGGTEMLKNLKLGLSTHYIETGKKNAFEKRRAIFHDVELFLQENVICNKKNTLFMVSLGPTACSAIEHISGLGYVGWDTGHFFQLAEQEIKNTLQHRKSVS